MKKYFFLLLCLYTSFVFSQTTNDLILYLDSLDYKTTEGNHQYSRIVKDYYSNPDNYKITEYYKDGKLKYEGVSENPERPSETSEGIHYYPNGNKKEAVRIKAFLRIGPYQLWYENGNIKEEGEYPNYELESDNKSGKKIRNYWSLNGVQKIINGNGEYEETAPGFSAKGPISDGYKHGIWSGENQKLNYTFVDIYENGDFKSGTSTDRYGQKNVYDKLFVPAEPVSGLNAFHDYLSKNIKHPFNPATVQGKVHIRFRITAGGKMEDFKITKSLQPLFDREALRVLSEYKGLWIASLERGIPTEAYFELPITFRYR